MGFGFLKRLLMLHRADGASLKPAEQTDSGSVAAPVLTWTEAMAIGDERIDAEHRHLIDLINRLHEAIARGFDPRVVETVLTDLAAFTRYHFVREERIMAALHYADTPAHQDEHAALLAELDELIEAYRIDPAALDDAALARVRSGVVDHIGGADARFAVYFARINRREAG